MKRFLLTILSGFLFLAVYAGEEINLNLVDEDVVFEYTSWSGDWYFGATDESGEYSVHLDYFADRVGQYGTFTNADLDAEYSYVRHTIDWESEDFAIGEGSSFTFAEDGSYYTLTGRLICNDGNTYVLNGRFKKYVPQTYDVDCQIITRMEYSEEEGDWYIRFKNDDYKFTFDLMAPEGQFDGTYTEADAYGEGSCFVTDQMTDDDIPFVTFTVTMKQSEEVDSPEKGCEITGTGVTEKGDTYNFHLVKNPPIKPTSQVDVNVELLSGEWPSYDHVYDGSYYELAEIENANMTWKLGCYRLTGEINEEEIDTDQTARINNATGEELKLDNGKVTQTLDIENRIVKVKAELVMSDSVQYNISFEHSIDVGEEKTYTFTDLWVDSSLAEYGNITLNASGDNCTFYFNVNGAEVPGVYSDANSYATLNITDEEGYENSINSLSIIKAECTLAEDGSPLLDCCFLGSDMNIYTIKASFVMPEITDNLDLKLTNADFYDDTWDNNGFSLSYNTENYDMICYLMVKSGDQVAGHYTIADLENSSYILLTDADGTTHSLRFLSGEFDVTDEDGVVTLAGTFQAGNYLVKLAMTTAEELPDGIADVEMNDRGNSSQLRYNIAGQRVDSGYRGIYIQNGRKYVK